MPDDPEIAAAAGVVLFRPTPLRFDPALHVDVAAIVILEATWALEWAVARDEDAGRS